MKDLLRNFISPQMTRPYIYRVIVVALVVWLMFKFVFLPLKIDGESMEPSYRDGGINFCFKFKFAFSGPERGDVVVIRLAGEKVMLLKRVIAVEGDTLEFKNGVLILNGEKAVEDYVRYPSDWNLAPRTVKRGYVYVVGDNRSVPIHSHRLGQTPVKRIIGGPLW